MSDIAQLEQQILAEISAASDEAALEAVRVAALGKSGSVSALLRTLGAMSPEERKQQGTLINGLKERVSEALGARRDVLKRAALDARLNTEIVDVTLPVRESPAEAGRIHPVSQVTDELTAIFADLGFAVDAVKMRFRPSFFPFTEPSLEVDIQCRFDKNEVRIVEDDNWLEILGCGMVHPNVLRNCGLDPDEYQGFAWGLGIDRIAMLKYGMPDLRPFFEADVRWLSHYGFRPLDFPTLAGGLSG